MNMYTKFIFLSFFYLSFSIFLTKVESAPVIDSISPAWGAAIGVITLIGSGFGTTPYITGAGTVGTTPILLECVASNPTDTLIKCSFTPFQPQLIEIVVKASGLNSNSVTYASVLFDNSYPANQLFYITGTFGAIQTQNRDKIKVQTSDQLYSAQVIWGANSLSWEVDINIIQYTSLSIIDTSTNTIVTNYPTTKYSAVVESTKFYDTTIQITGYIFTSTTQFLSYNSLVQYPISAYTSTSMTVTVPQTFFTNPNLYYVIKQQSNGIINQLDSSLKKLDAFQNDLNTDTVVYNVTNFDATLTTSKIYGVVSPPITPTSITASKITFTYPPTAQCGYSFISKDATTQYERITNSILVCPKPLIQRILTFPKASNNYLLIFNGKFLNNFLMGPAQSQALTYSIQYSSGLTQTCTYVSQIWNSNNSTLSITCKIPPVSYSSPFKITVTTLVGQTSTLLAAEDPTITKVSSSVYGQAGKVTITGTGFSSFDLLVTIGGSTCTNPVVSEFGLDIACDFASDVVITDSTIPLEVIVSISSTYIAKASLFYYIFPNPIITSSTSTYYGIPSPITIKGSSFYNFGLVVKIGTSSICSNAVASQDSTTIICNYESDIPADNINTPLQVFVSINTIYSNSNNVFYYLKPIQVSISSSTSTKYGIPGYVTIIGNNFITDDIKPIFVSIGRSQCTNPIVSDGNKQIIPIRYSSYK